MQHNCMNEVQINIRKPHVVMRKSMECSWQNFWMTTGIIVFTITHA